MLPRRDDATRVDGMADDPLGDAREFVAENFAEARWALLSGSVVTGHRTAGSDLDVVVLLADGDTRAPCRASRQFRGWPVETFIYDNRSLDHYLGQEHRRPTLTRMIATGVMVGGRGESDAARVQADCATVLERGPMPLTEAERAAARYKLTDLLDDLTHATDPGERIAIAGATWDDVAQQYLAFARHWTGNGKWLLRELRDLDAGFADQWLAANGDPLRIADLVREVLAGVGGPLFAGYRAAGQPPPQSQHVPTYDGRVGGVELPGV
jgi:hypothetical protein